MRRLSLTKYIFKILTKIILCPCILLILGAVVGIAQRTVSYNEELSRGINYNGGHVILLWNNYQHYWTGRGFVLISALFYLLLAVAVYHNKKMQVTDPETSQKHDHGRCSMYYVLLLIPKHWQYIYIYISCLSYHKIVTFIVKV